jgi:uncharacterized protein (TIGR02646 family)
MIHIDRDQVKKPAIFSSVRLKREMELLGADPAKSKFNRRFYGAPEIKSALMKLFHQKCAFCESSLSSVSLGDIEHFRPKRRAMQLDGTISEMHYWWLTYSWTNLYPICQICNISKRTRFPVIGARAEYETDLSKEGSLLLDPCVDDPSQHLLFSKGAVIGRTEKGNTTIEVFALNRQELIENRSNSNRFLQAFLRFLTSPGLDGKLVQETVNNLERQMEDSQAYAANNRQFLREFVGNAKRTEANRLRTIFRDSKDLTSYLSSGITTKQKEKAIVRTKKRKEQLAAYSVENKAQSKAYFSGAKRIESVEISNFRSIEKLNFNFPKPNSLAESWSMLIGENGTGKSSILQAVALALMGEAHCNNLGIDASRFLHKRSDGTRAESGFVKVHLTNMPAPMTLRFKQNSKEFRVTPKQPKVLLLGYGATRLLPHNNEEMPDQPRYIRVKNLFDPTAPLNDAEGWLNDTTRLPVDQFDKVKTALKDLLLLNETDSITRENGEIAVKLFDTTVSLRDLSDGFQSIVALSTDIMIALLEKWEHARIDESEAIVLLDEIEVHLHPVWKMEIVKRLRACFPRVSFLVTTHDPLCLKGLNEGEIIVLKRNEYNEIVPITGMPSVNDLRADQILTSFMFDLPTTRGDEMVKKIARYSDLLGKGLRSTQETVEFEALRNELSNTLTVESSPTQRLVEQAVQKTFVDLEPPAVSGELMEKERMIKGVGDTPQLTDDVKMEIKRQLINLLGE